MWAPILVADYLLNQYSIGNLTSDLTSHRGSHGALQNDQVEQAVWVLQLEVVGCLAYRHSIVSPPSLVPHSR
jgi:hypothetical protein